MSQLLRNSTPDIGVGSLRGARTPNLRVRRPTLCPVELGQFQRAGIISSIDAKHVSCRLQLLFYITVAYAVDAKVVRVNVQGGKTEQGYR